MHTIQVATASHPAEQLLRSIEKVLLEKNAQLQIEQGGIVIELNGKKYPIRDIECPSLTNLAYLPRELSTEKVLVTGK